MSWEKNISVIKKSLRCTTRRKDEWTLAQNTSPSPSSSPPETCLDSYSHFALSHSKSYHSTQQSMNNFAVASDCTEYVTIDGVGQRSVISHHGWFSETHSLQPGGRGHLKPSCWREVIISPVLDPDTSGVEWTGGEKGWSHTSPCCWITGDGKAVGFRARLIACLSSSDSCMQWIKLFPQAKGTCPAEGHCILCLGAQGELEDVPPATAHTHTHECAHRAQRAFGKHVLAPSWFPCTVTLNAAPGPILSPLLSLKLLQRVGLLLYTAAFLRALQIMRIKLRRYGNQGNIYHWQKAARIFLNQRFSYSRTFVTGADL